MLTKTMTKLLLQQSTAYVQFMNSLRSKELRFIIQTG